MNNAEFMQLISTLGDLDHHQRKRLSATLNQVGDEAKAVDLIEARFEANSVCPHCASADLHRFGCAGGLQRYRCRQCHRPSMP
jgi:transposase-like protein